jgi:hypothetical protein
LDFFICGVVCLFFAFPLKAQNTSYQKLVQAWQKYRQADDNGKEFLEFSFLSFLEKTNHERMDIPDSVGFLPGWASDSAADLRFAAHVVYVPFERRPDKLIYCLEDLENDERLSFSMELKMKWKAKSVVPVFQSDEQSGTSFQSLSFLSQGDILLSFPDIEAALLMEKLVRTRGGQRSFEISDMLMGRLENVMADPELFHDDFSAYYALSTLISPDEVLKILTWNVEDMDGDHHFYGIVAVKEDDHIQVYKLEDQRSDIKSPEYAGLCASKWYGAVYYEMIPVKYRGDFYYTLLGYNGHNSFSRIRVVDVITLTGGGVPRFDANIFDIKGRTKRRLLFEHSNQVNMMLRYDSRDDIIVMDHLAPLEPNFQNDRSYYGPDFSYDALEFKKGKWLLLEDIDLRNR